MSLLRRRAKVVRPANEESAYFSFKMLVKWANMGIKYAAEELDYLMPLIKYMGWDKDPDFRKLCTKGIIHCDLDEPMIESQS